MSYEDTLLFVGKCLTLSYYPSRVIIIKDEIQKGLIDWEKIVWITTNQLVFPAFYLQLKRNDLLCCLPTDLVEYMREFTELNRQRNLEILEQAKEITGLLNACGIKPIFLKGVANLLDGLYDDIAERMIGDIDFLVSEAEFIDVADVLINQGYKPKVIYDYKTLKTLKHYPRLINENRVSAVEIHRQILRHPYFEVFKYNELVSGYQTAKTYSPAFVFNPEYQILHNILNVQINDRGSYYGRYFLRQGYDLLLLLTKNGVSSTKLQDERLPCHINVNLALNSFLFGIQDIFKYKSSLFVKLNLYRFRLCLKYRGFERFSQLLLYLALRFSNYPRLLIRSIYNSDFRQSLYARLSDPRWYSAHIKSYKKIW